MDAILAWHHLSYTKYIRIYNFVGNVFREVLQTVKKCKLIVRIGMGFDNVDTKAAGELGIRVCNVPDYGVEVNSQSKILIIHFH